MFIHGGFILTNWKPDYSFPYWGFFITGVIDGTFLSSIPSTVFYLTVDRCLIISLKRKYSRKIALLLVIMAGITVLGLGVINFVVMLLSRKTENTKGCVAAGCLMLPFARFTYNYSKIGIIVFNLIASGWFLLTMLCFRRKSYYNQNRNFFKMVEYVVSRAIVFEIIFDFLPHLADSVFVALNVDSPLLYFGPFSRIIMTTDLLLNSNFKIPYDLFFITGVIDGAFLPSVSWTVFFLTLDKTCIILFKHRYNKKWSSKIATVCVILITFITVLNLVAAAVGHKGRIPSGCFAYGCLLEDFGQYSFNIPKLTVISANVVIGIIFLFSVYIYRNNESQNSAIMNTAESLIIRIIIFEFICNFIPHAVDTVYVVLHVESPVLFIGPFSRVIMAVDLLLSSMTNLKTLTRFRKEVLVLPGTIPTITV